MKQPGLLTRRSLKSLAAPLSKGWIEVRKSIRRADAANGQLLILAYHRIVPNIAQAERDSIYGLVVSTETFARHLEIVRDTYEVVTIDEAMEVVRGERHFKRTAALITIDDGYHDVYKHAWPVLKRLHLPAIVYLPTALIGTEQLLDHDRLYWLILKARERKLDLCQPLEEAGLAPERAALLCASRDAGRVANALNYQPVSVRQPILQSLAAMFDSDPVVYPAGYELMTWDMVREMKEAGIGFGSHSDRHLILTLESEIAVERELRRSKRVLEEQLNCPIRHFAWPNGYYNEALSQMAQCAGYDSAMSTRRAMVHSGDDPYSLGRLSLCEESTRGFSGKYSPAVARLRLAA